jgi:hypothetical protein
MGINKETWSIASNEAFRYCPRRCAYSSLYNQLVDQKFSNLFSVSEYLIIPKTLVYGYFSAIILIIAKIVYNLSCPELIRDYSPSDNKKYVDEKSGDTTLEDDLINYIRNALETDEARMKPIVKVDSIAEFDKNVTAQHADQLFGQAREAVQYVRRFFRFACLALYAAGFGLLFFKVFLPQMFRMYNAIIYLLCGGGHACGDTFH